MKPGALARSTTVWFPSSTPSATVANVNSVEVWPCSSLTVLGTVASFVLLEARFTASALVAGVFRLTVTVVAAAKPSGRSFLAAVNLSVGPSSSVTISNAPAPSARRTLLPEAST